MRFQRQITFYALAVLAGVGLLVAAVVTRTEISMAIEDPGRFAWLSALCVAQAWGMLAINAQYHGVYSRRLWLRHPWRQFARVVIAPTTARRIRTR